MTNNMRAKREWGVIWTAVGALAAVVATFIMGVALIDQLKNDADTKDAESVTTELSNTSTGEVAQAVTPMATEEAINASSSPLTYEMVAVPPGCFEMGHPNAAPDQTANEVETVCFDESFWIDKYEVTNEQYGSPPPVACDRATDSQQRVGGNEPDRARNCVTWYEAKEFCESRGARLPTEAEWEYAARGPEGRIYPWGTEFDESRANVMRDRQHEFVAPVDIYPDGVSWVGAYGMSGGLWEWTSSLYESYPYDAEDGREHPTAQGDRVLRGGSWDNDAEDATGFNRGHSDPGIAFNSFGFRCVSDETPTPEATPDPSLGQTENSEENRIIDRDNGWCYALAQSVEVIEGGSQLEYRVAYHEDLPMPLFRGFEGRGDGFSFFLYFGDDVNEPEAYVGGEYATNQFNDEKNVWEFTITNGWQPTPGLNPANPDNWRIDYVKPGATCY